MFVWDLVGVRIIGVSARREFSVSGPVSVSKRALRRSVRTHVLFTDIKTTEDILITKKTLLNYLTFSVTSLS